MACNHLSTAAGHRPEIAQLVIICRLAISQPPSDSAITAVVADAQEETALTDRQVEVLRLLAQGFTYQEVSEKLEVSRLTVKNHASAIYNRLGVTNKTEAIFEARALGLIP